MTKKPIGMQMACIPIGLFIRARGAEGLGNHG